MDWSRIRAFLGLRTPPRIQANKEVLNLQSVQTPPGRVTLGEWPCVCYCVGAYESPQPMTGVLRAKAVNHCDRNLPAPGESPRITGQYGVWPELPETLLAIEREGLYLPLRHTPDFSPPPPRTEARNLRPNEGDPWFTLAEASDLGLIVDAPATLYIVCYPVLEKRLCLAPVVIAGGYVFRP